MLENGSPDHGEGSKDETSGDLLDGCEPDALLTEVWVDEDIHDCKGLVFVRIQELVMLTGNDNDDANGVQVLEQIVGDTVELHGGAHARQVGVHLPVGEPEDGNPEEDGAGTETTSNLINPGVVKVVPLGRRGTEVRWLDLFPHGAVVPVLPGLNGVCGDTASEGLEEELEGRAHDVAARGTENVVLLAEDEDRDTDDEHDGGDKVGKVETDVALSVDHTDLADQCTNVDEEVEPVVDTGNGDSRVDDDALALLRLDAHALLGNLLGDEGRNVGLECSGSETHDDESENEDAERGVCLGQNGRGRGGNQDDVADLSNEDGVEDGLVATEVGVGNPCSEQRADVDPERVERGQTECDLLPEAEGTRLGVVAGRVDSGTGWRLQWLGDEVGVDGNGTIVRHALYEFNESDLGR